MACYPGYLRGGTWDGDEALLDDFEVIDLIDVALEFFYEVGVELKGEFSLDVVVEDEFEDGEGEFVPEPEDEWGVTFC